MAEISYINIDDFTVAYCVKNPAQEKTIFFIHDWGIRNRALSANRGHNGLRHWPYLGPATRPAARNAREHAL